jgi:hypothetical protein
MRGEQAFQRTCWLLYAAALRERFGAAMTTQPNNVQDARERLLKGPRLKISRARHHIGELDAAIAAFLARSPFEMLMVTDPPAGRRSSEIHEREPIPDEFAPLVGDAVHNMRSAMDLLVFAMVGNRVAQPDRVQFPFPKKAEALLSTIANWQLHLAGPDVVAVIKALRPYPGGDELLYGMQSLDIVDKHKLVIAVVRALHFDIGQLNAMNTGIKFEGGGGIRVLGAVNVTLPPMPGPITRERAPVQPTFEICFAPDQPFEGRPIIPTLGAMADRVSDACAQLAEAFIK